MDSILVVGLGNPGAEYLGTRHNVGFEVVDELMHRFKVHQRGGKGDYLIATHQIGVKNLILAKPLTYMNNSGTAVAGLLEHYGVSLNELLVVVDDIALPLGTIRIRTKGSDGGHNGLLSIIYQINSDEFARIRCGIRQAVTPPKRETPTFVLSAFDMEERAQAEAMIARAADAVIECATAGPDRAMSRFNTRL